MRKQAPVRVAIIGTGGMANRHAECFREVEGCQLVAGVDVDPARAKAFCEKHAIPNAFQKVQDLLNHGKFDAVSVVTPDAFHAEVSIACLEAAKHVLCEKPLAVDYGQALEMVAAAKRAGTINMVNFSYRDWPCIQMVAEAVRSGEIGEIRHVESSYLQSWLASNIWGDWRSSPGWLWRLSSAHGSKGVLGDIGVHILDFATFPVGPVRGLSCRLKTFGKAPGNRLGEYTLDANDSAVMNVEFESGALGVIHTTRWAGGHANRLHLKIAGDKGTIEIDSERSTNSFRLCHGDRLHKAEWEEVQCKPVANAYQRFITAVQSGVPGQPDFVRGAEIQRIIDACFESDKLKAAVELC